MKKTQLAVMLGEKSFISHPLGALPVKNAVIILETIFLLEMDKAQKSYSLIIRWNF